MKLFVAADTGCVVKPFKLHETYVLLHRYIEIIIYVSFHNDIISRINLILTYQPETPVLAGGLIRELRADVV